MKIMAKKCPYCHRKMREEWNRTTPGSPKLWGWSCSCGTFINKQTGRGERETTPGVWKLLSGN